MSSGRSFALDILKGIATKVILIALPVGLIILAYRRGWLSWIPGLQSILDGVLGEGGLLETAGGITGQAAEGIGLVVEQVENGVEVAADWGAEQIYLGDSGDSAVRASKRAGLTAENFIYLIETPKEELPVFFRPLKQFYTYETFRNYLMQGISDTAGHSDMVNFNRWLNVEAMKLLAWRQAGGEE